MPQKTCRYRDRPTNIRSFYPRILRKSQKISPMPNHDSLQEQIKKFEAPETIEAGRIVALKMLPEKLREIGFA